MNSSLARSYLALLGVILVAVGGVTIPSGHDALSFAFVLIGALGLAFTSTFGTSASGLTDKQQAYLSFISNLCIAFGAISVPAGFPWYIGLFVAILGAIGHAIKEATGTVNQSG